MHNDTTDTPNSKLLNLRNQLLAGEASGAERLEFIDLASKLNHRPSVGLLRQLLNDEDALVRYDALNALAIRMAVHDREMVAECHRLLRNDQDGDVRRLALGCLGSINVASFDLELFQWVRQGLMDQQFEPNLIETAFEVLFQISGRPASEWPDQQGRRTFMTYDEIDWDRVAELEAEVLAGKRKADK